MTKKRSSHSKKWIKLALFILALAAIVAGLELTNTTYFFHKSKPASQVIVTAGVPKQEAKVTKTGGQSDKSISTSNGVNKQVATDTNGQTVNTDESLWIKSASGAVIVKQPAANATVQDGSVLGGSASVDQIQYRLIDDKLGVISEGQLSVKNGNFSGVLHFKGSATTGRLDVFSYDSDGTEINEVQIAVKLGS